MGTFRKKPVVVHASVWNKPGDNPLVQSYTSSWTEHIVELGICQHCGVLLQEHGWIGTLEGGHVVCPGDWIITGIKGEYYPCKPDIFQETYEAIEEEQS